MAVFEVHMTVEAFLAAQLNVLRSKRLCPPPPQTIGGASIQVQQIEFLPNAIRHDIEALFDVFTEENLAAGELTEGLKTQIAQPIIIHASDLADIKSRPNQPPSAVFQIPCTVILDLTYYPLPDECFMALRYESIEWGDFPPLPPVVDVDQLKAAVETLIKSAVAAPAIAFTFAAPLPGGISRVDNAGVTVDRVLRRIVFRAERGGANDGAPVRWSNFYKGFVENRIPAGERWALFIDKPVLEGMFQTMVWNAVASSGRQELRLISVGASYSNAGGKASVDTTIYANIDLPDPLGWEYIEPVINSEFSTVQGLANTLVIDIHMPDLKQVVADVVSEYFPGVLEFLLWPLPQITRGIAESEVEDEKLPSVPLPSCTQITEHHTQCSHSVASPDLDGIQFRFTELVARLDGILLTGPLRITALTASTLDIQTRPFRWTAPRVSCGVTSMAAIAYFHANGKQAALAEASIFLTTEGTTPAYFCGFEVIDDNLGVFSNATILVDSPQFPTRMTIRVPNPPQAYRNNPYNFRLLIRTTIGTRLVELPPIPALTDADLERMLHEMLGKLGLCYRQISPWFKYPRGFNPRWHVDPPWDGRVEHRWQVRINGLPEEESASLVLEDGAPLVTVFGRGGRAPAMDMIVPSSASAGISLIRHGGSTGSGENETQDVEPEQAMESLREHGVEIVQQLLWHTARLSSEGLVRRLAPSNSIVSPGVLLVLQNSVRLVDLSNPFRPVRAATWYLEAPCSAFDFRRGVLAGASDGLWLLDESGRASPFSPIGDTPPVIDVALGNGLIYVLTRESLEMRSFEGHLLEGTRYHGGRAMLRLGRHLAIAGEQGVTMLALSDSGLPGKQAAVAEVRAVALHLPPDGESDSILAVLENGSASLLQRHGDTFKEIGRFSHAPWFAGVARIGQLVVRPAAGQPNVEIGISGEQLLIAD